MKIGQAMYGGQKQGGAKEEDVEAKEADYEEKKDDKK